MFQVPRGTRDFNPEEMQKRKYVENTMRTVFKNYGYKEIQTPIFESLELFTAKSGDEIINEIYSFKDKSGRKLALRPELTAPVIRFYVEKLQMKSKPLKLFYFGPCFRYDRPQKGRYREFMQAGCELIGTDTAEAHAELIALSYKLLSKIGLKNINLNIGNLNILSKIFDNFGINTEQQRYLLPLIDKEEWEDIFEALQEFHIENKKVAEFLDLLQTNDINKIKKIMRSSNNVLNEIKRLEEIIYILTKIYHLKNIAIKMSIVRGLEYYKGIVFEIEASKLGAEKQICGGGTYNLVKLFKGKDTPTSGFAIGFDRTILALEIEDYKFPKPQIEVYIIPVKKDMTYKAIEISNILREHGFSVEIDLMRRGITKALKHANSINAKKTLIIGSKEMEKKSITIRDMNTGEQKIVKINNLVKKLN